MTNKETIFFLNDNAIDMGSSFDLFHPAFQAYSKLISEDVQKRRHFLRQGKQKFSFKAYKYDWRHFQLVY